MRQVTLCLLIKDNQVLLAMKKRGFGAGKWNGYGGKKNSEETLRQAAIREMREESGITPSRLTKVGLIDFIFPEKLEWDQQMTVYKVIHWEGEPIESEEMAPKWFDINNLPLEEMWEGDKLWLPDIINGQRIKGKMEYGQNQEVRKYNLEKL